MVASNPVTARLWPISHVGALVRVFATLLLSSQLALAQFTQQGPKLVGTGAVGGAAQNSVALSADGNTAIVGGPSDNYDNIGGGRTGATWVPDQSAHLTAMMRGHYAYYGISGNFRRISTRSGGRRPKSAKARNRGR